MEFLFADIKVGLMLKGELLNVFGSFVNVIAYKRLVGYKSAPSASRSAPRRIHTFRVQGDISVACG
jgi:hypothetical protein